MNSPSDALSVTMPTDAAATLFLVPRAIDRLVAGRRLAAPLLGDDPAEPEHSAVLRGAHPDLLVLSPPEKKERIGIDQVREVIRRAQFTPVRSARKVCLIPRAEALTPEAANALLKIMEEPPRNLAFVLLAEHPSDLLPTIVSRCRTVRVPPPSRDSIVGRLLDAGYAPDDAAWLAGLTLRDGDLDRLLETHPDMSTARDGASVRRVPITDVIGSALSDDPIARHVALQEIVGRIGSVDPDLLTVGVRMLAAQERDILARFLHELLGATFGLLRSRADRGDGVRDRIDSDRLRSLCRAIDTAYRSIAAYGPAEAVLVSLLLTPGGDDDGQ